MAWMCLLGHALGKTAGAESAHVGVSLWHVESVSGEHVCVLALDELVAG